MAEPPKHLQELTIYHPEDPLWPDPPRPEELSQPTMRRLQLWLGANITLAENNPSAENLASVAILHWNIGGDRNLEQAEHVWEQARKAPDYTRTAENEPARTLAEDMYCELDEYDLTWRTLRLVVATMREESLERQGYTAYLAAQVAASHDKEELVQAFTQDAEAIFEAAQQAGENVSHMQIYSARMLRSPGTSGETGSSSSSYSPVQAPEFDERNVIRPPETQQHNLGINPRILPAEAVEAARRGIL